MIMIIFVFSSLSNSLHAKNYTKKVKELIEKIDAPIIKVEDFKTKLNHPDILIWDAREPEEYQISHIQNAIHIGYKNFSLSKIGNIKAYKNKMIIVYCSVGYRSAKVVETLQARGIKAFNLFGGIIEWKNQGYKVVNMNEQETNKVHTYNRDWGKWLINGEAIPKK